MQSMVMRPNNTTQKPEQSKNSASTMPNRYSKTHTAAKMTLVATVNVPIHAKNAAEPIFTSICVPIAG